MQYLSLWAYRHDGVVIKEDIIEVSINWSEVLGNIMWRSEKVAKKPVPYFRVDARYINF